MIQIQKEKKRKKKERKEQYRSGVRYRKKMMVGIRMNSRWEFNGRYFRFNYHVLGVHYKAAGDWNHFDADAKTIQSSSCPRNRSVNAMGKFRQHGYTGVSLRKQRCPTFE